jgi:hypothetical protein
MLIDMHAHSAGISTCCKASLTDVIHHAREKDMDGVVLTNHYQKNYLREGESPTDFAHRYLAEYACAVALGKETGFSFFFGIEVTMELYKQVHMLVYGVDEDFVLQHPTMYDYTQAKLYAAVQAAGGTLIQAHPMRHGRNVLLDTALLDGIEISSHLLYDGTHYEELAAIARVNGLLLTSGGDFHKDTPRPGCGIYLPDELQSTREIMAYLHTADRITLRMQECAERPARDEVFCKTAKQAFPHL